MMRFGSRAIARANAALRAIPPDSSLGINCAAPRKPTASSLSNTKVRISFRLNEYALEAERQHCQKH